METASEGEGVGSGAAGISVAYDVKVGGVAMRAGGWGEGSGGNSPVVTWDGETKTDLICKISVSFQFHYNIKNILKKIKIAFKKQ